MLRIDAGSRAPSSRAGSPTSSPRSQAASTRLLARTRVPAAAVDRVFLTGGSSLVPAVRRIFALRFGEEKLRSGGELTSVASGLALRAAELAARIEISRSDPGISILA